MSSAFSIEPQASSLSIIATLDGHDVKAVSPVRMIEVEIADTTWLRDFPDGPNVILAAVGVTGVVHLAMPLPVAHDLAESLSDLTKKPRPKKRTSSPHPAPSTS